MRPITREIIDRRQPLLRWGAVFAGATIAVALWVLLQMIGMGAGLAAIDLDDAGSLRSVGIGTGVWTLLSPLIALFAGGYFAGKLAVTWDQRSGLMHAFIAWAIASIVGVLAIVAVVSMLTRDATRIPTHDVLSDDIRVAPGLHHLEIQRATSDAGRMLLGGGISLLLGLGAAAAGGALSTKKPGGRRVRHDTQEVPVAPPPPEPPADALHVTAS
jgi:hypothetical protein